MEEDRKNEVSRLEAMPGRQMEATRMREWRRTDMTR
jgi:hypothetical protein